MKEHPSHHDIHIITIMAQKELLDLRFSEILRVEKRLDAELDKNTTQYEAACETIERLSSIASDAIDQISNSKSKEKLRKRLASALQQTDFHRPF